MSFAEKVGKFLLFVILTLITLGIYPLWWLIVMLEENNHLLRQIRDKSTDQQIQK